MGRSLTFPFGRLLIVAVLSLAAAACQTNGETVQSMSARDSAPSAVATSFDATSFESTSGDLVQAAAFAQEDERYMIEFRSRYALSYGHTFVIFGRLDDAGQIMNPQVAGLSPAGGVGAYAAGHVLPVKAETGPTDGDLEDEYMSANWRVPLTKSEYDRVVPYIRKLQANSPVWQAELYNCNAFVGKIARFMGYKTAFIWLRPQQFITKLREMNGGPNAVGETRAAG